MACVRPTSNDVKSNIGTSNRVFFNANFTQYAPYNTRLIIYDRFGRIVGGSVSSEVSEGNNITNSYESSGNIILCFKQDDLFGYGDDFVIQGVARSIANSKYVYSDAQGLFIEDGEEFTTHVLSENLSGLVIDLVDSDNAATYFGEEGSCPFIPTQQEIYEGYEQSISEVEGNCSPIPYSWTTPAYEKAMEVAPSDNAAQFFLDLNSSLISSFIFMSLYQSAETALDFSVEQFFFAVDVNGVVRMTSAPQDSWFNESQQLVMPYVFGVQTAGLAIGDPLMFYYVNGSNLYYVNSGVGDGTVPFALGKNQVNTAYFENVKTTDAPCMPILNTSIWGWLDEMEVTIDDAALASDLQEQIGEHDSWFDENAVLINNQIYSMQTALGTDPSEEEVD